MTVPLSLIISLIISNYNRGQNLWNNVKKSSKIRHGRKLWAILATGTTVSFLGKTLGTRICLHSFFQYFIISWVLSSSATREATRIQCLYTIYQALLCLRRIEPKLKLCNVLISMSAIVWNVFSCPLYIFHNDLNFLKYRYFCLKRKFYRESTSNQSFLMTLFNLNQTWKIVFTKRWSI